MLHTEVSTALRQEKPLDDLAYSWPGREDSWTVSNNPSSTLDAIGVSDAELQASYAGLDRQNHVTTSPSLVLKSWPAEDMRRDPDLVIWAEMVPGYWKPIRLTSGPDMHPSISSYLFKKRSVSILLNRRQLEVVGLPTASAGQDRPGLSERFPRLSSSWSAVPIRPYQSLD